MKTTLTFTLAMLFLMAVAVADSAHSYKPKKGYVPDEKTAIAVARAVWEPIYGKETIDRQSPFIVSLKDEIWTVTGSLPKHLVGGVALIQIKQSDCQVIRVSHGK
jgi:hypothetical protein